MKKTLRLASLSLLATAALTTGCTRQTDHSFSILPVTQAFPGALQVNTMVDMLWVVDNSASMDVSQDRLRKGFQSFAAKYLKPNWDIRIGVITTDTYLANPAFASWRASDNFHKWDGNYSKLVAGIHDGPIAASCTSQNSYFFYGESQCSIRDAQGANTGPSHCLNPAGNETSITQCVNTLKNNTIHSGKAVLTTQPPAGTPGDAAWVAQLADDFMINASAGSAGNGSERGLGSVLQLLSDNEGTPTALFRKGSTRVIVFLSDEDDQTQAIPSPVPAGFGPFTGYSSSCASKTVDGYTYRITSCPDSTKLTPVATIKSQLDAFFNKLDGGTSPNYLVVPIVALSGASIQQLQLERQADDQAAGNPGQVAVDRGDRYIALANLVGKGSFSADIGDSDYSSVLDNLGQAIVSQKSVFQLDHQPGATEDITVTIRHADGSTVNVPATSYSVSGTTLTFTDPNLVLSLGSGDTILITYIPKSLGN